MKPLKDFISRIPESNYYVDYTDNKELVAAIEEYAQQFKNRESPPVTGTAEEILYTESEARLLATRFAHECRLKNCITSNDTITAYDAWYDITKFVPVYLPRLTSTQSTTIERLTKALREIVECTGTSTLQNKIAREALASIKK